MALIKCPECGNEISDKASACIHCGFLVNKMENIAVEDGKNIELENDTKSIRLKKKAIILIGIVALVLIMVLVWFLVNHSSVDDNDLYNNIAWGTSYEDTKNSISGQIVTADEDSIMEVIGDYNGQTGVTAVITYDFSVDGTLHMVDIFFAIDDESDYTGGMLWDEYEKEFSESFGEGEVQDVSYSSIMTWTTSKSEIYMEYMEVLESALCLKYSDVSTLE